MSIILTNRSFAVTYWNDAAERLWGWAADEVIGRDGIELLVPPALQATARDAMAQAAEGKPLAGDVVLRRRDGTPVLVRYTVTPLLTPDGEVKSVLTGHVVVE